MATEEQKAAITTERGRQAAKIKNPEERKAYVRDSADVDKDYEQTAQATSIKGNELQRREVLGGMEGGGWIDKTGLYKLHEGEHVIPALGIWHENEYSKAPYSLARKK